MRSITTLLAYSLLIFTIFPSMLFADDIEDQKQVDIMSALATTSLTGSAMKTTLQAAINIKKTDVFTHAKAMEAMEVFRRSNQTVDVSKFGGYLTFKNLTDSEDVLREIKLEKISAAKKLSNINSRIDSLGLPFDMLDLGTNTYDFVQNFGKAIDSDGNVWSRSEAGVKATKNLMDAYQASTAVASTIVKFMPKSSAANFWANNALAKGVSSGGKYAKGAGALGAITIGAQIESIIYQHFRDGSINEITGNISSDFKISIDSRKRMVSQLRDLYFESMESGRLVGAGEVADILASYPIHRPKYSGFTEDSYQLSQLFLDKTNNASYLSENYEASAFTELSNANRIMVALDALVDISTKEDAEMSAYLQETVTEGGSVADIIFSSLEGSSIYDIYDTTALKKAMFPYYDTTTSGVDHYNGLYKIAFKSEVANYMQQRLAEFGRKVRRLQDAVSLKEARDAEFSRLLEIPATQVGDKIAVTFGLEVDYRDELLEAAALNLPFKLRYQDSVGFKVIDATYDETTGRLIFDAPTTEAIKLHEILMPRAPRWDGDTDAGYSSYSLPVGNNGVFAEVVTSSQNINLSNGLIAHYEFEDNANDSSGNNNHGAAYGGVTYQSGVIGNAASFDGIDDRINISNDILNNREIFSISFWVKTNKANAALISGANKISDNEFLLYAASRGFLQLYYHANINNTLWYNSNINLLGNEYKNIVVNFSQNETVIFVDGQFIQTLNNGFGTNIQIDSNGLWIGMEQDSVGSAGSESSQYFSGQIDDLRIYDRHLNEADIEEIYNLEQQSVNLNNGLIAHYEFDGDANDSSGNANHAILSGAMTSSDRTGTNSNAMYFDGNDVMNAGNLPINRDAITLSTWAKLDTGSIGANGINTPFFDKHLSFHLVIVENDRLQFSIGSGEDPKISTEQLPTENEWFHVAATYAGSQMKLYLDGLIVAQKQYTGDILESSYDLFIASDEIGNFAYLAGMMDDARIYNRALSEVEIHKLSSFESFNLQSGLVAHYEFEENANDSSGNANHGTENGGVSYVDGVMGKAGSFDGNSTISVNSFLDTTGDSDFSISFWMKSDSSNDIGGLVTEHSACEISYDFFHITLYNNSFGRNSLEADLFNGERVKIPANEINNDWHKVDFVYIDGGYKFYLDGTLKDTILNASTSNNMINNSAKMVIGGFYIDSCSIDHNYNGLIDDIRIYNRALNEAEISQLYNLGSFTSPINATSLINENYRDGTFATTPIIREWTFTDNIEDLTISVISNSYQNIINSGDFVIQGNTLSVDLTPNLLNPINRLDLQFTNANGEIVKVSGSDTFWSLTKTNHAPRLADGQSSQLVSLGSEPAYLNIDTYDADGDAVTLTIEDAAGGYVGFDPDVASRVFASFSDGVTSHTIKIGLDDGKEKIIKSFDVNQFNSTNIQSFYSDVDPSSTAYPYSDIAFVTIQGVFSGQPDPSDPQLRIFRPSDNASMAEVLKVIINAGVKTEKFQLDSSFSYLKTFPNWASPYYTYARESGAVDDLGGDLSILYPTREQLAQLLSKLLKLDEKLAAFDSIAVNFTDKDSFSNEAMHRYGQIVKVFGLFLTDDNALPQQKVSRAELAGVIKNIFMMPGAELVIPTEPLELGDFFDISLSNIKAQKIAGDYSLVDSSSDLKSDLAINQKHLAPTNIDTYDLNLGENQVVVMIDNNGVRDVVIQTLDLERKADRDGDGISDEDDAFPDDKNEWLDSDTDGTGNNADTDDDGDGIDDTWEIQYELDPLNAADASLDNDGDLISNLNEFLQGTNPLLNENHKAPVAIFPVILNLLLND